MHLSSSVSGDLSGTDKGLNENPMERKRLRLIQHLVSNLHHS
jgi:hypothetical protein